MQNIDLSGWWWLPGKEDDQVPGNLTYSNNSGLVLELLASFKKMDEISTTTTHAMILGMCKGGKLVTLADCLETNTSLSFPGYLMQRFYARRAYIGANFRNPGQLKFRTFDLQLTYLPDWLGRSGFAATHSKGDGEDSPIYEVAYQYPEELRAKTPKGEIVVTFSLQTGGDHLQEVRLQQYVRMRITWGRRLTFDDALSDVIRPMQNFMTLATTKPNIIESLAVIPDPSPGESRGPPIQVLFSQVGESARSDRRLFDTDMLFSADDVADDFQEVMSSWLILADELDSVCNLLIGPRYMPSMYTEHQFLNAVQAAEVYHRRRKKDSVLDAGEHEARVRSVIGKAPGDHVEWLTEQLRYSNEPRLRHRLSELFDSVRDVMVPLVDSKRRFIRRVVDTRNFLTHYDASLRRRATQGSDLHDLTRLVTILVEACLIGELGITGSRRLEFFMRLRRV